MERERERVRVSEKERRGGGVGCVFCCTGQIDRGQCQGHPRRGTGALGQGKPEPITHRTRTLATSCSCTRMPSHACEESQSDRHTGGGTGVCVSERLCVSCYKGVCMHTHR